MTRASQLGLQRHAVLQELQQCLGLLEGLQPGVDKREDVALDHAGLDGLCFDEVAVQSQQVRPDREGLYRRQRAAQVAQVRAHHHAGAPQRHSSGVVEREHAILGGKRFVIEPLVGLCVLEHKLRQLLG